jgi:16S rRNA (guanine966-N2)-methyltransferase
VLASLSEARRDGGDDGPLAGHVCLDLFAGSGALGIEALSRGAAACTFVERDRQARRVLEGNLARLGLFSGEARRPDGAPEAAPTGAPPTRVIGADYRRALAADAHRGARYTLLFVDPPYEMYAEIQPVLAALLRPVLAPGAVLVVETAARTRAELPWRVVREKRYGDTRVTFLVAGEEPTQGERTTMMQRQPEPAGALDAS